jgi:hypothetical protein
LFGGVGSGQIAEREVPGIQRFECRAIGLSLVASLIASLMAFGRPTVGAGCDYLIGEMLDHHHYAALA